MDDLQTLRSLAGIQPGRSNGSNISVTGTEKAEIMRQRGIKPGSQEWFKLWFSKPYLTGEKPV